MAKRGKENASRSSFGSLLLTTCGGFSTFVLRLWVGGVHGEWGGFAKGMNASQQMQKGGMYGMNGQMRQQ